LQTRQNPSKDTSQEQVAGERKATVPPQQARFEVGRMSKKPKPQETRGIKRAQAEASRAIPEQKDSGGHDCHPGDPGQGAFASQVSAAQIMSQSVHDKDRQQCQCEGAAEMAEGHEAARLLRCGRAAPEQVQQRPQARCKSETKDLRVAEAR